MLKSNRSVYDSHTTYCKILLLYLLVKAKTNLASGHWSQYTENWFNNAIILRSAVGNVSGYRCEADCRSRGREFHPGPVPYFHGD